MYGTKGIVAASQPLAVQAGLEILSKGGNAGECDRARERWRGRGRVKVAERTVTSLYDWAYVKMY